MITLLMYSVIRALSMLCLCTLTDNSLCADGRNLTTR